ncbi:MAG: Gfo/Idh/MocA family oxidoreductase [Terriglobia bacterium]|jgi:predicted dehydrogenase
MQNSKSNSIPNLSRREFLAGTGAAAVSINLMRPETVSGTEANSKIAIGLIGCGGRGTWIADLFLQHGGYQVVAAADYFRDRVDAFGEKFRVEPARRFTGLSGYKKVLDSKVDAVVIESPPYFHPEQAAAGVDAGVHVYLAKPIAVDVPGCQSIAASSEKAAAARRCFLVDFQTRTEPLYQEAVKRAQSGDIGRLICGEAAYFAGSPWVKPIEYLRANPQDPERRLRAWGVDRVFSGDVITEQNIHSIDVATWILDHHPLSAVGTGGLNSRTEGTCWDHFSVIYRFPDNVLVSFCSKQFGSGYDDILCRVYGTDGDVETHYQGEVNIKGKSPYEGGKCPTLYRDGAVRNIATFYENVVKGDFSNPTVAPSVRSNLTTILGRTAAYKNSEVTWDEMMSAGEKWELKTEGLKA